MRRSTTLQRARHAPLPAASPSGEIGFLTTESTHFLGVRRLTVTNFRSYEHLSMEPQLPCIVLAGENGAGKTNLLEAVSLLTPGRGLRAVALNELARHDGDGGWAVAARVAGRHGDVDLGTGLVAGTQNGSRQVRVDGNPVRGSGVLGDHVRILWLTPAMDRLFSGPAGDRRRFLDRLVAAFDPAHGTRVNAFEKVMRERNRLLDRNNADPAWLDGLETQMAEYAVSIAAARRDAIAALAGILAERRASAPDSPFPWVALSFEGEIEALLDGNAAVEVEDQYRRILADSRSRDAAAGRTLRGPHRTDLLVVHGPKNMAADLCSTGEQKALLIAMVLAHARVIQGNFDGYPPVLLLDEIAAHLDEGRRRALFDELSGLGAQVWMTGTDAALFEGLGDRADRYRVGGGTVSRQ